MPTRAINCLRNVPPLAWLLVATVALLLPFLNKAFHIDDTLFLRSGEQIQRHPLDFYGFNINWFETSKPMVEAFWNPPLVCYALAIIAKLTGWRETGLHAFFLIPALACIWGTYRLASRFCVRPWLAAALTLVTPAFLVSATSVMCEITLTAFWIWTLVYVEKGIEQSSLKYSVAAGLLAGLAFLTKYEGLALVPLTIAYGFIRTRKFGAWIIVPLVPILTAAGYQWVTTVLYGKGLLTYAAGYSDVSISPLRLIDKTAVGLAFAGGSCLSVMCFLGPVWDRRALVGTLVAAFIAAALALTMYSLKPVVWNSSQRFEWFFFAQAVLLIAIGTGLLGRAAAVLWEERQDPVSWLLCLWLLGIFVFAAFLNWTVTVRSFLPLLPAAGILVVRRLENHATPVRFASRRIGIPLVGSLALALIVTISDYEFANANRSAAIQLAYDYQSSTPLLFEGHWGFQYYMERAGAKALDFNYHKLNPGEMVVVPSPASHALGVPNGLSESIEAKEIISSVPCAVMTHAPAAGFYGATFGPMPFLFGQSQSETFSVLRIVRGDANSALQNMVSGDTSDARLKELEISTARRSGDPIIEFQLASLLTARSRTSEAILHYRAGLKTKPDDPNALNNLAWLLTTTTDSRERNPAEAVNLANKACDLTHFGKAQFIGTLAAAHAANSNFVEAVAVAEKAVIQAEKEGHPELAETNRKLLELYRRGQPFSPEALK